MEIVSRQKPHPDTTWLGRPAEAVSLAAAQAGEVEALRAEMDTRHMAPLRHFIGGSILERVLAGIREAEWEPNQSKFNTELLMVENQTSMLLHFLMHSQELFGLVEELTGCSGIGRFGGRTYRMLPEAGHSGTWHTDLVPGRAVAISINLSEQPFQDGAVEMRDSATKERISMSPPLECGDALLLRLRPGLEHRVRAVQGANPKTAFAGFFYVDEPSPLAFPHAALTGAA